MKQKYFSTFVNHFYFLFYELSLQDPYSKIYFINQILLMASVFFLCKALFYIKTHQKHNHFLHITGKANCETIWDFIRDVFKCNHTTNKYLAKAKLYAQKQFGVRLISGRERNGQQPEPQQLDAASSIPSYLCSAPSEHLSQYQTKKHSEFR